MLLTIPRAAKLLGLSRQRVHALVKSGAIRADMVGRDWLIGEGALAEFRALRRKRGRPKGCRDKTRRARKTPRPPADG